MYEAPIEPVLCPCCGKPIVGVGTARTLYERMVLGTNNKPKRAALPRCPVLSIDEAFFAYGVNPCGCLISAERAGAITAEIASRQAGNPPKALPPISDAQRQEKIAKLAIALIELHARQEKATGVDKQTVDYWIVVVVDQLDRLQAGPACVGVSPKTLEGEVIAWALSNNYAMPPSPVTGSTALPENFGYDPSYPLPSRAALSRMPPPLSLPSPSDRGPVNFPDLPLDEAAAMGAAFGNPQPPPAAPGVQRDWMIPGTRPTIPSPGPSVGPTPSKPPGSVRNSKRARRTIRKTKEDPGKNEASD